MEILHANLDEPTLQAKKKELLEQHCPKVFGDIQSLVSGKFVLGDKFSVADVSILSIVD